MINDDAFATDATTEKLDARSPKMPIMYVHCEHAAGSVALIVIASDEKDCRDVHWCEELVGR